MKNQSIKLMKTVILILIIVFFSQNFLIGQKSTRINKYSIGVEVDIGHSFPNFDREQERWKGTFYPAGGLTILFADKINQSWTVGLGVGITGYALTNNGPTDKYVLDFTSPHILASIGRNFQNSAGRENFVKLTSGFQQAYQGVFVDEFATYKVTVSGKNKLYYFLRPEIGVRRYFKRKMKGARYKTAYEFGAYFRYNLNALGSAKIEENNFEITLEPRGSIIGGYFSVLFPAGRKHMRMKQRPEKELPPIIYNPRYLE